SALRPRSLTTLHSHSPPVHTFIHIQSLPPPPCHQLLAFPPSISCAQTPPSRSRASIRPLQTPSPHPPPFSTSSQFSPSSPSVNSFNSVLSIRCLIFFPYALYLCPRLFTPILSLLTLHHLLLTSSVFSTLFAPSPFPSDWYPLSLSLPSSAPLPRSLTISFPTSFFVLFLPTLPFG
ncbi:hypothetical protein AYI69_g5364, partial [Smittium culicis]